MPKFRVKTLINAKQYFTYIVKAIDEQQAEDIIIEGFEPNDSRVTIENYECTPLDENSETIIYLNKITE